MTKRNLLFIMVLSAIALSSFFLLKMLLDYLREQNLIHLEYDIEGDRWLKTDYAFAPIRTHLLNNGYHLSSEERIESEAVIDVKANIPKILKYTKERNFYNYWRLMGYLQSEGKYSVEKELIEYLLTESEYFNLESEYRNFFKYLNEYYLSASEDLIRNNQYVRAKWMIEQALVRLLIIDSKPLNHLRNDYRTFLNNVLIQRLLIENPEDANIETNNFRALYELYKHPFWSRPNLEEINKLQIPSQSHFYSIVQYIIGTKKLREGKSIEAFEVFKNVDKLNNNHNLFLTDLNMHLLARCIFWHCHNNKLKNINKSVSQLKIISGKISNSNFKTDIKYYISYLKAPPKSYYEDPKPETENYSDFIIELNL